METGTVKWFDQTKGFGFVVVGGRDVLLHVKALTASGFRHIGPGDEVTFERVPQRAAVAKVHSVRPAREVETDGAARGVVKWFNRTDRFGFVARDGLPDVLVSYETLRNSSLATLQPGDRVTMRIERRTSGDFATAIRVEGVQ